MLMAVGIFILFFIICFVSAAVAFFIVFRKDIREVVELQKKPGIRKAESFADFAGARYFLAEEQSYVFKVNVFSSVDTKDRNPVTISCNGQHVSYAKEFFDRAGAAVALILVLPVFLILAVGIKISSKGPVIYGRPSRGMSGRVFNVYKFRTMFYDAASRAITTNKKTDHRITKIGRFMRRTSLDKLPQLFNVLLGDMSLVGPHPYRLDKDDLYASNVDGYLVRYAVKPGMTGWAQIYSHGADLKIKDAERQTKLDIEYVQLHSVWLDLKILVCAFVPVLRHRLLSW